MESTVVKETISGDRIFKEMSDGRILVEAKDKPSGTMYGTYAKIKGEVTDEKLAKAKEMVVEDVCRIIREIAEERDGFFIIKTAEENPFGGLASVGCKFFLPTVNGDDDYKRFKEGLIIE